MVLLTIRRYGVIDGARGNADVRLAEGGYVFEHLMPEALRQTVSISYRHIGGDLNTDIDMQPMSKPPRFGLENLTNTFDVLGSVPDFVGDSGIDAVKHPGKHGFGRLPNDAEDGDGDDETDDRIGQRANHTPIAPRTTARLVNPSVRA
jgi:hypothetical protein